MNRVIVLFGFLLLWSFVARSEEIFLSSEDYAKQELALITYAEELVHWRHEMGELYKEMAQSSRANGGALDSRELKKLRELVTEFKNIHKPRFKKFQETKPYLIDGLSQIELTNGPSQYEYRVRFDVLRRSRRGRNHTNKTKAIYVKVNLGDDLGSSIFKHFRLQLAAKLVWLESYSLGFAPFFETKAFRHVLIRDLDEAEESHEVERLWFEYMESVVRTQALAKATDLFKVMDTTKRVMKYTSRESHLHERSFEFLMDGLIKKNHVLKELGKYAGGNNFFKSMIRNINFMAKRRWDTYQDIGVAILFSGSQVFGNTAGLFQSRNGHLYYWSKEEEEALSEQFKPLDIIFEKTPFRLTDRFIPGHFGHAAIWTGGEEELKEIGVWRELKDEYKAKVRAGHRMIEALRPGVQFNTFRHFLDIDDLAVMRLRECGENEEPLVDGEAVCLNNELKREYLMSAFAQVGKDYDFAFDVNTEEEIVCSELMYRTFLDVDFETSLTVGQYNISPDQVAKQGIEGHFQFILMIHKGSYVEARDDELASFITSLMTKS